MSTPGRSASIGVLTGTGDRVIWSAGFAGYPAAPVDVCLCGFCSAIQGMEAS